MSRLNTAHAKALDASFYDAIREDPQVAALAAEARMRLLEGGFYETNVVAAAFQKWERDDEITLIDAYGFAHVWHHYLSGEIACATVPLPNGPGRDRNVEYNQTTLDQLPSGFRAEYVPARGRGADDDGSFAIEEGIGLHRTSLEEGGKERVETWFPKARTTLALEVGTTSVSKTLFHLRCGTGVARWPYGYDKIIVLARHPSLEGVLGAAIRSKSSS